MTAMCPLRDDCRRGRRSADRHVGRSARLQGSAEGTSDVLLERNELTTNNEREVDDMSSVILVAVICALIGATSQSITNEKYNIRYWSSWFLPYCITSFFSLAVVWLLHKWGYL